MTCSRSWRAFGLEPAFWAAEATLRRLRQGMSSKSWREAVVPEARAQVQEEEKPGRLQRKTLREHSFDPNGQAGDIWA